MSEDTGAVPTPLILDESVIIAVARADPGVTGLILDYDAKGQPLVIPALVLVAAALDVRTSDTAQILRGLERLDNVTVAPLRGAEQASRLADVIAKTGLDPWDAHVAAVALAAICPVLTLNAAKWRQHTGDLDDHVFIVEITTPSSSLFLSTGTQG